MLTKMLMLAHSACCGKANAAPRRGQAWRGCGWRPRVQPGRILGPGVPTARGPPGQPGTGDCRRAGPRACTLGDPGTAQDAAPRHRHRAGGRGAAGPGPDWGMGSGPPGLGTPRPCWPGQGVRGWAAGQACPCGFFWWFIYLLKLFPPLVIYFFIFIFIFFLILNFISIF